MKPLWILNNKLNSFATFPTTMMSQRHVCNCRHRHSLLFKRVQRCGGDFHSADTHTSSTHTHTHTVHINSQNTIYSRALFCVSSLARCLCFCTRLLSPFGLDSGRRYVHTSSLRLCPFQLHLRQRATCLYITKVDLDLGRAHSFSSPID